MRFILLLLLVSSGTTCLAQDADFTDMRNTRESFSRIYDKTLRSDLTAFTVAGIAESVNKPVLKQLPAIKYGDDFITYDSNNLQITIKAVKFIAAKHKLLYDGKYLTKIDNKPYFGNYTKVPQAGIALVIVAGKDTVLIPPNAYSDLYNPHFTYMDGSGVLRSQDAVYISGDKHRIYIYMLNKDDHGSYEVTWVIQDNKYLRRVIDYGFTPGQ